MEAERRGEHELALRLRFRAGLLRLDERGAIELRPSLPTGEVVARAAAPTTSTAWPPTSTRSSTAAARRARATSRRRARGWEAVLR